MKNISKSRSTAEISFINHASFVFFTKNIKILSDPWYWGNAFDSGWKLIYENPIEEVETLLQEITHIYLSHEHPDHFSVAFFNKFKNQIIKNNISLIFQSTRDQRVYKFFNKLGIKIIQLNHKKWFEIAPNERIFLYKNGIIDSALIIETKDALLLNINDCDFNDIELFKLNRLLPKNKPRIICVQFSYAAWRSNKQWLKKAANYKLLRLSKVFRILKGNILLPFASFIYFSHQQNYTLNSYYNSPQQVSKYLSNHGIQHTFLKPCLTKININYLLNKISLQKINKQGLDFWKTQLLKDKPLIKANVSEVENINSESILIFLSKIRKNNNLALIWVIRYFSFGMIFGDTIIKIKDLNEYYLINFKTVKILSSLPKNYDIEILSDSFNLMLSTPHGLDTLSVNGRLREQRLNGFNKFIYSIGFQVLNSSGYGVKIRDIFSPFVLKKIIEIPIRLLLRNS